MNDHESFTQLQAATDTEECKVLGAKITPYSATHWRHWAPDVLLEVTWQRFVAKPAMARQLEKTGDCLLVDAKPVWNDDDDDDNSNLYGWVLMMIRDRVRVHHEQLDIALEHWSRRQQERRDLIQRMPPQSFALHMHNVGVVRPLVVENGKIQVVDTTGGMRWADKKDLRRVIPPRARAAVAAADPQ